MRGIVPGMHADHMRQTRMFAPGERLVFRNRLCSRHHAASTFYQIRGRPVACVIRFTTDLFDVANEPPNPINPIAGASALQWLRERVLAEMNISEPAPEDWGWYSSIDWNGRLYMLGASAEADENGAYEWVVQIEKQRTAKEKLFGREKMAPDDPCASAIRTLLESEPRFRIVSIEQ
jgi:hypothetical protein